MTIISCGCTAAIESNWDNPVMMFEDLLGVLCRLRLFRRSA